MSSLFQPVLITAIAVGPTDRVYVATSTGENGTLYALTSTGDRRWEHTYPGSVDRPATGPDGTIYFETGSRLYALAPNGSEMWTLQVGDVWRAADVRNSRLVLGTFDGRVIVIDHGEVEWTYTTERAVAPAFGPDAQRVYAVTSRSVFALEDGTQRWRTEIGATVLLPSRTGDSHRAPRWFLQWIAHRTVPNSCRPSLFIWDVGDQFASGG